MKNISRKICSWLLMILMVCLLAQPVFADVASDQDAAGAASESYAEDSEVQAGQENQKEDAARTPEPVEVSSVGISRAELSLTVGESAKLTASCSVTAIAKKAAEGAAEQTESNQSSEGNGASGGKGTDAEKNRSAKKEQQENRILSDDNCEKVTKAAMLAGSSEDAGDDIYKTTLSDGEYPISSDAYTFGGGTGKASLICSKVIVKDGRAKGIFTIDSSGMTHVYYGGIPDTSDESPKYFNPETGLCGEKVVPIVNKSVTIPVVLNEKICFAGRTTAMSAPHWISYWYKITLEEPEEF